MRFVIVTGMSGAGKSTALKMLEDAEYFCVDNPPISLIEKFAQLTMDGTEGKIKKSGPRSGYPQRRGFGRSAGSSGEDEPIRNKV